MEDNKLIAEFMGFTYEKNIGWYDNEMLMSQNVYDQQGGNCFDELLFHESWDWLMPVIEKIETLGYTFEKNYQPIDKDWQSLIVKGNDILYQEFNDDSLKSSYYVLVEFIKQYNENERLNNEYISYNDAPYGQD